MAKSLYISTTNARSGKSTIVLGIMQLLMRDLQNVGFFRPIINPSAEERDPDTDLVLSHFYLGMRYEDTYAMTLDEAKKLVNAGKQNQMIEIILSKYKQLEEKYDFVLCEGIDFVLGNEAFTFDINAVVAANMGCPALVVTNAHNATIDEIVSLNHLAMEDLENKGVDILGIMVNRAEASQTEAILEALEKDIKVDNCSFHVIPEDSNLMKPTVADLQKWLGAEVIYGKKTMDKMIDGYVIAAMQINNFLNYIKEDSLVVTAGDRTDIILSAMASRLSSSYPNISGILLTGGIAPSDSIQRLVEGWEGIPVPILLVKDPTYPTMRNLNHVHARLEPDNPKKIASALGLFEAHVDTQEMRRKLVERKSVNVTPQMFEYNLIQKAKKNKQHIVLPEGTGERILNACDILLRRDVCEVTLLGKEAEIQAKIFKLGLDLSGAHIVEPTKSPLYEEYVQEFYEMRKTKKGMNMDVARDLMSDVTYFATMMVHKGNADGMVSGSVNTTAHTIKPAFQIIKTKPDASIVSSIFLMCLKDRVLAFGDCAVNPTPNAEQLAEVAIGSAQTAEIFGVEPRVAMLSYSTGSSGKGAEVEKVIEATRIAKERCPDLLLEGPIQYDAAIDPSVAKTKLPDSKVAGQATVFIFPDLNTGNNTYKAVQRSSDQVVAIGPVLQGLNKPVNDLSRGCTVPDIVNTVAITAVQAQAAKGLV
ncbi:phosphate acetyltransferase [Desulfoluna sp.]|uniref:phosphate acetyltransferase n=1 Tax=Desulfoluna sp. TaxID=2045199 RepID=UPI0026332F2D|nr:phosphate acetyltransferase [Desulfoluna sp.]